MGKACKGKPINRKTICFHKDVTFILYKFKNNYFTLEIITNSLLFYLAKGKTKLIFLMKIIINYLVDKIKSQA